MIDVIAVEVPEYARPLEGSFGRGVRRGVEEALSQFVTTIRDPRAGRGAGREIYVQLGRGELRQGRSLDSLLAAYRAGARVAWRRLSGTAERAGLPPEVIYALADAIFAYIDELSAESAEGYAAEQAARQDQARIRRDRLLSSLLLPDPPPLADLERLAAEADWRAPATVAALVCAAEQLGPLARSLPAGTMSGSVDGFGCLLLPGPDGGAIDELRGAVGGLPATLGLVAPWTDAGRSWEDARAVHALRGAEALEGDGLLLTEDVLAEIVLLESAPRIARLAARRLGPLDGETPASRARLLETLRASLRHQGRIRETADELHVHPQTVRYRLSRLRDLLGDALDDPDARFDLDLVLRAEAIGASPL